MKKYCSQFKSFRNGFTIIEIAAALVLLTVCLVAFSQLFAFVVTQRDSEKKRQAAVDQLQNVFEQLGEISNEKLAALDFDLSDYEQTTRRAVPDGKIEFSCEPAELKEKNDSMNQSKIFQITVSWDRGKNRPRGEVSMFRLLTLAGKGEAEE